MISNRMAEHFYSVWLSYQTIWIREILGFKTIWLSEIFDNLLLMLTKYVVLTPSDRPIRGTLFDVFKKKFSKSLNVCDRRPRRGTFLVTFKKNPGVSVFIVLLLHAQKLTTVRKRQNEIYAETILQDMVLLNCKCGQIQYQSCILFRIESKHRLHKWLRSAVIFIRRNYPAYFIQSFF